MTADAGLVEELPDRGDQGFGKAVGIFGGAVKMAAPVTHHLAGEIHQRQVDVVDRQTDANRIDRVRLELQKGAWPSTRLGCFGLLALQAQDQSLVQKIGGDGRHVAGLSRVIWPRSIRAIGPFRRRACRTILLFCRRI